eukprot:gene3129-3597_t
MAGGCANLSAFTRLSIIKAAYFSFYLCLSRAVNNPGQVNLSEEARCYGIEALLRLQNLRYDVVEKSNSEFISPSGRIPLIRIDDDVIGEDSILSWLEAKGFCLTKDLPNVQKLQVKSLISLFETSLVPAELYCCWVHPENVKKTMDAYGSVYCNPLKFILTHKKQASVKSMLKVIGWLNKTTEEVEKEVITILSVVAVKLDKNIFLVGDTPTEADALLFGHLQAILSSQQNNKLLLQALDGFPELVRYCVAVGKLCGFNRK